jgi:hypothetical protein
MYARERAPIQANKASKNATITHNEQDCEHYKDARVNQNNPNPRLNFFNLVNIN